MRRFVGMVLVAALLTGGMAACGPESPHALPQDLLARTLDLSREYVSLRYRTDVLLTTAESYPDLDTWRADLDTILGEWADLEAGAGVMEDQAERVVAAAEAPGIPVAAATVRTDSLQDVFDAAPAGRKLRTLAAHLGTDARTALRLLEQEAAAEHGTAESYDRMLTAAVVIKDTCKVVGFVGAVVATGGVAAATATTLGTATLVVTGADLVLEVADDAATIALGDGNKVSQIAQSARIITEPIGAILTVANLPANVTRGVDKLTAFAFGAEGMRAAAQDGRIIGIQLPAYRGEDARVTSVAPADLERWLASQGVRSATVAEALGSLGLAVPGGAPAPTPAATPAPEPAPEPTSPAPAPEPAPAPDPPAAGGDDAVVGLWIGYVQHDRSTDWATEGLTFELWPAGEGYVGSTGEDLTWSLAGAELTVVFASGRTLVFAVEGDSVELTGDSSGTADYGALSRSDLP